MSRTVVLYEVEDDEVVERFFWHPSFSEACKHASQVAEVGQETQVSRVTLTLPGGKDFKASLCRLFNREHLYLTEEMRRYIPTTLKDKDNGTTFERGQYNFKVEICKASDKD